MRQSMSRVGGCIDNEPSRVNYSQPFGSRLSAQLVQQIEVQNRLAYQYPQLQRNADHKERQLARARERYSLNSPKVIFNSLSKLIELLKHYPHPSLIALNMVMSGIPIIEIQLLIYFFKPFFR